MNRAFSISWPTSARVAAIGLIFAIGGLASAALAKESTDDASDDPVPIPMGIQARMAAAKADNDIQQAALPAVAAVDAFAAALKAQNFEAVFDALDPGVIVLETGGAERSREEYMGHHAIADALFMTRAEVTLLRRTARIDGDTAWVASETETRTDEIGVNLYAGTETMILKRTPAGWKIVHIHWSSRPKPSTTKP